jgi:nitrite reductase (NADH) small subunit
MAQRRIGTVGQIPPGEGRNFTVDGVTVAVFRTRAGAVFATQAKCPHRGGPLADGLTDAGTVMCPLHDRIFDLATGQEVGSGCALTVYPVRVEAGGAILLDLLPTPAGNA